MTRQLVAAIAIICSMAAAAGAQTVTGPIPVTANSYPLLAANRVQEVLDLAKLGYVEEEYIITGTANVYTWAADGSLKVKTPNAPYGTRILVRRPADPARFSGNVVVELLNEARSYDWAFVWGVSYPYFVEHGDAFVGITHFPQNIDSLKKFNPTRYAALSYANPNPTETCGAQPTTSNSEEGLRWDSITQIGALLKSKASTGPMAGFNVQNVFLTSHHGQAVTYAIAFDARSNRLNGKPIFDGYMIKSSDNPTRLSRCDAAPPNGDPRQVVKNLSVPMIRVVPQSEVLRPNASRRPDSDAAGDRFRLYEVPGAPRMDKTYFQHLPFIEDQVKAGQPASNSKWPYDYRCTPDLDLIDFPPLRHTVNAAFAHLDQWVRAGTPPPRAERIAIKNAGTPQAAFDTDEFGNARGGVRSPYLDVPVATYSAISPGQCNNIVSKTPFDWQKLQAIYGSPKAYSDKVVAAVDRLVKERWLLASDAAKIKSELVAPAPGSNN
jgi:hypothetical protein